MDLRFAALGTEKQKLIARTRACAAVDVGALVRPDMCDICGTSGSDGRIMAHHDDYSEPLKVRWLCTGCHARLHAIIRRARGKMAHLVVEECGAVRRVVLNGTAHESRCSHAPDHDGDHYDASQDIGWID